MEYTIKPITCENQKELDSLIKCITISLPDSSWFLPINHIAEKHFFNSNWTYFLGCFYDGKLIGASALFYNKFEWGYSAKQIGLEKNVAEIGRSMVLPEYRSQNIMYELNSVLINTAKDKKLNYLIATVHPDNIGSKKSLEKSGFVRKKTIYKEGHKRDVMLLTLSTPTI